MPESNCFTLGCVQDQWSVRITLNPTIPYTTPGPHRWTLTASTSLSFYCTSSFSMRSCAGARHAAVSLVILSKAHRTGKSA